MLGFILKKISLFYANYASFHKLDLRGLKLCFSIDDSKLFGEQIKSFAICGCFLHNLTGLLGLL